MNTYVTLFVMCETNIVCPSVTTETIVIRFELKQYGYQCCMCVCIFVKSSIAGPIMTNFGMEIDHVVEVNVFANITDIQAGKDVRYSVLA